MAKLSMFSFITLDGFFKGSNEDISWHNFGDDEQKMSEILSNSGHIQIFGRVTYEMMHSYWASPEATKNDPVVTRGMNDAKKIVFSKTLSSADWQNTTLIKGDMISEIKKLKVQAGPDLVILGSGQIVAQLAEANMIDEYSFLLNPLAIGNGTSLFKGLSHKVKLNLRSVRTMKSGNVLLTYIA